MSLPVVFDLDGTLIDSLPDIVWSFRAAFEAEAAPLPVVGLQVAGEQDAARCGGRGDGQRHRGAQARQRATDATECRHVPPDESGPRGSCGQGLSDHGVQAMTFVAVRSGHDTQGGLRATPNDGGPNHGRDPACPASLRHAP